MVRKTTRLTSIVASMLFTLPGGSQEPHQQHGAPQGGPPSGAPRQHAAQHASAPVSAPNSAPMTATDGYLMRQVSGTATNPASAPEGMFMVRMASWTAMLHGVVSANEIQQSGQRGGDKFFVSNWFMGIAQRRAGAGSFQARAMLSLEPATVTKRRYPLLFQSGETAFGQPIADGQHPHDFVMELGAQYALPISENGILAFYGAVVGDPALGPVAFSHRISAQELPQATLGHHIQDSSHIANTVVTIGVTRGVLRIEASGFHGQEPDENRWDFDGGAIDSWASRLTLSPTPNWSGQVSVGRLKQPEAHEPYDVVRATASATYSRRLDSGFWAASVIWGRNHKSGVHRNLNSYLAESVVQFQQKNYVTARVELVDRDELLHGGEEHPDHGEITSGSVFRIGSVTLGYTRALATLAGIEVGLGGNFTLYSVPAALAAVYGDRPAGFLTYLRFRLRGRDGTHPAGGH